MDLPNFKELKAILKLCRSQGVTDITLGGVSIKFGDMPSVGATAEAEDTAATPSDEELTYWSTAPDPLAERLSSEQ